MNILLACCNTVDHHLIAVLLEDEGHHITSITAERNFLPAVHAAKPDLIILGPLAVNRTAVDMLTKLRKDSIGAETPVLIYTQADSATLKMITLLKELRADYLPQPNLEALLSYVREKA